MRSIKLYADGRIDYQGKSGSVIGATARLEKSGEKHRLRDTRKVVLRIEGPGVAIAAALAPAAFQLHRYAEDFVAQVNQISNHAGRPAPAHAPAPPPAPPSVLDLSQTGDPSMQPGGSVSPASGDPEADPLAMDRLIGQLERLGKLRDSGVLTENEFQEQKAALLRASRNP